MPVTAAPRTGISRWSSELDPYNRTQQDADHALLDDLTAIDLHDGTLAARPAVGVRGRYYTESAASAGLPGTTWREDGVAWRSIGSRVLSTGTGDVAQVVAGVTAQTADLQQWRGGASTLGRVDNTGQLFAVGAQLGPSPQTALAAMLGVTPSAAAAVAAIIRGAVSQSGDLQQWQSNGGGVLARVDSTGAGTFAGLTTAGTVTGRLARWSSAAVGDVPVQVTGFAGQTGNLQEWRSSTPTVVASVDPTGVGTFAGLTTAGTVSGRLARWTSAAVGDVPAIVKGMSGQTGDLQQWQSNTGAVLAKVDSAGVITSPAGALFGATPSPAFALCYVGITSGAAGNLPLAVRAASGQTNDLAQWQSNTGAVLTTVDWQGRVNASNGMHVGGASHLGQAFLEAFTTGASTKPLIVRGASAQSANLQEWQNSSGTAMASVDPSGGLYVAQLQLTNPVGTTHQAVISFTNNAVFGDPPNPGSGGGYLYSIGGALKYRGGNGTITTVANA